MFNKLLSASRWANDSTDWASLILRLMLGFLMAYGHGFSKLQSLLDGNMQFANPIGIGDSASLYLTVFAEFVCSILLILGLGTRFALIPLIITMFVAVFIIHAPDALAEKEHAIMYLMPYIALFLLGSGRFSLDALLNKKKS